MEAHGETTGAGPSCVARQRQSAAQMFLWPGMTRATAAMPTATTAAAALAREAGAIRPAGTKVSAAALRGALGQNLMLPSVAEASASKWGAWAPAPAAPHLAPRPPPPSRRAADSSRAPPRRGRD